MFDYSSLFIFHLIFFNLVGNQDIHKSIYGKISSLTMELSALEHLKNIVSPGFLGKFIQILIILADNRNWHNILRF